ncbi:helix-turn-helix domain-containing protein [Ochrobactrum soli]|uniref:Helix-turn-helix domain-containing protein n=1 Tax=Ochrobactrum soli TaxID=2448455 RepID=A0A849KX36_9HYPH|nr:helix-turn-helix domain-containing protein [[Ochrobactrum] soli]
MMTSIAQRVQSRLKKLNLSMRKASLDAGLSDAFIRNIISGKSESPRGINLSKLAHTLQTTESWLLTGDGPEDAESLESGTVSQDDKDFISLWRDASDEDRQVILALLRSRRALKDQ